MAFFPSLVVHELPYLSIHRFLLIGHGQYCYSSHGSNIGRIPHSSAIHPSNIWWTRHDYISQSIRSTHSVIYWYNRKYPVLCGIFSTGSEKIRKCVLFPRAGSDWNLGINCRVMASMDATFLWHSHLSNNWYLVSDTDIPPMHVAWLCCMGAGFTDTRENGGCPVGTPCAW